MKKNKLVIIIIIIAALLFLGSCVIKNYNNLVNLEEDVNAKWSQVEVQLQRRYDLIPNIVETAKGYADFEKETLTAVIEARSKIAGAQTTQEKIDANNMMESAIARLLVVVEKYPELKANENFKALIVELEGTENRISVERKRYNDAVMIYNKKIRTFPGVIYASLLGFEYRPYFESEDEASKAPKVKF